DCNEVDAHLVQLGNGCVVEALVVFAARLCLFALTAALFPLLLLFRRYACLLSGSRRFGRRLECELIFEVANAQLAPVEVGVPIEGDIMYAAVLTIRTIDRIQHQCSVFHGATDGTELVHSPGQRHRARARHETKCWTQSCGSAARRWRGDGAECLRSNGKGNAACGGRRHRASRRSTRSLPGIPGIASLSAEPFVAHRYCAERELGYEHSASLIETLHHGRVLVDVLLLESACAPSGAITLDREQVFCAPRKAVQRAAILARRDLTIGLLGVRARPVLGE